MLYPTIIQDNFFEDINKIVELADSLEYAPCPVGRWPGERSEKLHLVHPQFFNHFCSKFTKLLFPNQNVDYNCTLQFQRISNDHTQGGWIHKDPNDVTAIVYISKHKNCGTSLYKAKDFFTFGDPELESFKNKSYMTKKFTKQSEKARLLANEQYEKTLEIMSLQNRLIAFEGLNPHGVENFREDLDEDRVTLIGFFHHISASGLKYPTVESRRVL